MKTIYKSLPSQLRTSPNRTVQIPTTNSLPMCFTAPHILKDGVLA